MFSLSILLGVYSYIIYAIGLSGLLYKQTILIISALYIFFIYFFYKKRIIIGLSRTLKNLRKTKTDWIAIIFLSIIVLQMFVNFIGTLGPELAFDALWYHLTLPKIYLTNHSIDYIPGGLLYYSTMPKLTEMFYAGALALGSEIFAKLIHFSSGILSLIVLYKLSRNFFSSRFALFTLALFYSNIVVGWMSITAYVELTRTFFEAMALYGFLNWWERGEKKWLIESSVMLGLAVSTKLLALGSLFIFSILIFFYFLQHKKKIKDLLIGLFIYWFICLLIPLPWFVFSYLHTGNPLYPFFTSLYPTTFDISLINPIRFIYEIWIVFTHAADPVSPIYIIILPLVLFYKKFHNKRGVILTYSLLSLIVWYITPRTGGGRFILPYLPALSISVGILLQEINKVKKFKILKYLTIGLIMFVSLVSIIYRFSANAKYIPVILGKESKDKFLSKHLNFSFGDFYDTDGFFRNKITKNDKVLLYGFHNLYYVNFPFVDSSFVKRGDEFNYIAVQNSVIPHRFRFWNLIYYNSVSNVKVYSLGGQRWIY